MVENTQEYYDFWDLVNDCGEAYAHAHDNVILDAMELENFSYNSKFNAKYILNKFWSLAHEERINILYNYFDDDRNYWEKELKGENNV